MALQARRDVEAQSRKPEMLEHFMAKAAKEHSRAGPTTVSVDAEERRKAWVDKRLIEYGRMRARTLGWPDVYTFTKAMGERAVEELAHERGLPPVDRPPVDHRVRARAPVAGVDRRLQDGRPDHPRVRAGADPGVPRHPGGDRRPDPGRLRRERDPRRRGARRSPPASPPTTTCRAATGTRCGSSSSTSTCASTSRRIRCPSAAAASTRCRRGTFPGNLKVERMLRRAEKLTDLAEQVVTHLPKSKAMRDAVTRVDRDQARVDFVKRYSDLYGDVHRDRGRLHGRACGSLCRVAHAARTSERFPFDAGDARLEVLPAGRALPGGDAEPARAVAPRSRDADGPDPSARRHRCSRCSTWRARSSRPTSSSPTCGRGSPTCRSRSGRAELVSVFGRIPGYLQIDRRDRGDFLRTFFRRYEGASVAGVERVDPTATSPSSCSRRRRRRRSAGCGSTARPGTARS